MGLRGPQVDTRPLFDRVLEKVEYEPNTGCWLFSGANCGDGYGVVSRRKIPFYTHRVSYEHHNGRIPFPLKVLHKCDTPACVNPAHLRLGTNMDNTHDMMRKNRTSIVKISSTEIKEIEDLLANGCSQKQIALWYGVVQTTISKIKRGARFAQRDLND